MGTVKALNVMQDKYKGSKFEKEWIGKRMDLKESGFERKLPDSEKRNQALLTI